MSEEELLEGITKIAADFYSIKSSIIRSFVNNNFNPIKSLVSFTHNITSRMFYKREKLSI